MRLRRRRSAAAHTHTIAYLRFHGGVKVDYGPSRSFRIVSRVQHAVYDYYYMPGMGLNQTRRTICNNYCVRRGTILPFMPRSA